MVKPHSFRTHRKRAALMTELLVALGLLTTTVLPIAYSIAYEKQFARVCYERAVAMEILDGEMEILLAGEWKSFPAGTHDYSVHANSAANLPAGKFLLTVHPGQVRLEWRPDEKDHGGRLAREASVK